MKVRIKDLKEAVKDFMKKGAEDKEGCEEGFPGDKDGYIGSWVDGTKKDEAKVNEGSIEFSTASKDFVSVVAPPFDHNKLSQTLNKLNQSIGKITDPNEKNQVSSMIGVLTGLVDSTTNQGGLGKGQLPKPPVAPPAKPPTTLNQNKKPEKEGVSQSKRSAAGYTQEEPTDYDTGSKKSAKEEGISQEKRAKHGYKLEVPVDYKDLPGEGLGETQMPALGQVAEAAPSDKAEDFIKANKGSFQKRYGPTWKKILYATAMKKFGKE